MKCVVCVAMEGEGQGGVSGRDKLCMCLVLCVCVCVCICVGGEGVTSYFTRLDNFDEQRFLNKRRGGSNIVPKSINQCIISYAEESRIKVK